MCSPISGGGSRVLHVMMVGIRPRQLHEACFACYVVFRPVLRHDAMHSPPLSLQIEGC